jgi:hypothetical protein
MYITWYGYAGLGGMGGGVRANPIPAREEDVRYFEISMKTCRILLATATILQESVQRYCTGWFRRKG